MVVFHKPKADALHRLSEIRNSYPFARLPFDMVRTSIALFMAEILVKCLREEESNEPLYRFLEESVVGLDRTDHGLESYHLLFMCRLAGYLGFGIESAGQFLALLKEYRYSFPEGEVQMQALEALVTGEYEELKRTGRSGRAAMLSQLLFYFRTHLENFGDMKSLDVLKAVLR